MIKTKFSNVMIGLQAVAALCVMGAVKIWAPVCEKMLTLANGKEVHMKCFYTGQAAISIAVILLVSAVMAYLCKKEHRKIMTVSAVGAMMLFLLFGSLIGVCANTEMRCQITALWGKGAAIVILAASIIDLVFAKEGQVPG